MIRTGTGIEALRPPRRASLVSSVASVCTALAIATTALPAHASGMLDQASPVNAPAPESGTFAAGQTLFESGKYLDAIRVWDQLLSKTPENVDTRLARQTVMGAVINAARRSLATAKPASVLMLTTAAASRYVESARKGYPDELDIDAEIVGQLRNLGERAVAEGKRRFERKSEQKADQAQGVSLALCGQHLDALAHELDGDDTGALEVLQSQYARARRANTRTLAEFATSILRLHLRQHDATNEESEMLAARDLLIDLGRHLPQSARTRGLDAEIARVEARTATTFQPAPEPATRRDDVTDDNDDDQAPAADTDKPRKSSPPWTADRYRKLSRPLVGIGAAATALGGAGIGVLVTGIVMYTAGKKDCELGSGGREQCNSDAAKRRRTGASLASIGLYTAAPALTAGLTMLIIGKVYEGKAKHLGSGTSARLRSIELGVDRQGRALASIDIQF